MIEKRKFSSFARVRAGEKIGAGQVSRYRFSKYTVFITLLVFCWQQQERVANFERGPDLGMALSVVREFYYVRELFCHDNLKDSRTGMPNVLSFNAMFANGPAIKGGCVTRRKHRSGAGNFSQIIVPVQGGYGVVFAIQVQILLSITRVAVQGWSEPLIYPRLQNWLRALAQCRGTNSLGARNLSR